MSNQIETHRIVQFTRTITHLAQQRGSMLRSGVDVDAGVRGKRTTYDQLNSVEASEVTTRHGDTEYTEVPHARRHLVLKRFDVADLVDEADQLRVLNDPVNAYSTAFGYAMGRAIDDQIILKANATALTGEEGTGTAGFPAGNIIGNGSGTGMTIAKWRQTRELLEANEELEDEGPNAWFTVMSARQRRDLLATTEVTSSDFNTIRALVGGQINSFLGFTTLKSERLTLTGNERECLAWVRSGIKLGIGREPSGDISVLPGKRLSTQVFYRMDIGATRMRETAVAQIDCDES